MISRLRTIVRHAVRQVARVVDHVSVGHISPNAVTLFGTAMHVPIVYLIATRHNVWAAVLLVIFGLFDTLDGELARLQQKSSVQGMLLDASTDRVKEVLLYCGVAYVLALSTHPTTAVWAVAACGASLLVSYVKAKGEAAVATSNQQIAHEQLNRMFSGGLLSFEIRMVLLVIGLLANQLLVVVAFIAVFASFTALQRLMRISKQLA